MVAGEGYVSGMSMILVVDDEPAFQQITQIVLQRAGYTVICASNGQQALEMLEAHTPNLIILDEMMPGMAGSDVCRTIKCDPRWKHIPVIMHTASVLLKNPERVAAIKADGVLFKPTLPNELVAAVARILTLQVS